MSDVFTGGCNLVPRFSLLFSSAFIVVQGRQRRETLGMRLWWVLGISPNLALLVLDISTKLHPKRSLKREMIKID